MLFTYDLPLEAGSGGVGGAEYDKAGGESAGAGGASGAYISDKVFTVTSGETLTSLLLEVQGLEQVVDIIQLLVMVVIQR